MTVFPVPFAASVLHPTDFSPASEAAFAHALALAVRRQGRLTILNASTDDELGTHFPPIRETLERWGLLEEGSARSAIRDGLGVEVRKLVVDTESPFKATMGYLYKHHPDLVVLATEGRDGVARFLRPSVAERVLRVSGTMTLFVPEKARGLVSHLDGAIRVNKILVPVDFKPDSREVVIRVSRVAGLVDEPSIEIVLLHVGGGPLPTARPTVGRRVRMAKGAPKGGRARADPQNRRGGEGRFGRDGHRRS